MTAALTYVGHYSAIVTHLRTCTLFKSVSSFFTPSHCIGTLLFLFPKEDYCNMDFPCLFPFPVSQVEQASTTGPGGRVAILLKFRLKLSAVFPKGDNSLFELLIVIK